MAATGWRVVLITTVSPVAGALFEALRGLGHEPVAVVSARRSQPGPPGPWSISDATAPPGLDVLFPRDRHSIEPLLRAYAPDLAVCWGYPWRIPLAALEVPRLGSINHHPAFLPRHRGPIPVSWAIREGDASYGVTWHRMDADLDTGAILAQASVPARDDEFSFEQLGPRMLEAALSILPRALDRLAAGDPGDPQAGEGATWAGHFDADYAEIDWSAPAAAIHRQVRAWAFAAGTEKIPGPIATIDGQRVKVTRTSLADPGDGARRMDAGDGPIWVVAWEPVEAAADAPATESLDTAVR
jgi:methionyl-tRNA formyltransferase